MTTQPRPFRLVVMMGVTGCGKSTVGEALAAGLGTPFLDGDDYHPPENVAKMSAGTPLTDDDRWPWLDGLGAVLRETAAHEGQVILACSALRRVYRERLAAAAGEPILFVFLDGPRELIARRLAARSGHYMPAALLDSQFATLERPDADETVLTIDIADPVEDLVRTVRARLAPRREIGIVGLGVMGANLARNMIDKGFGVAAFDPWPEARDRFTAALDDTEARSMTRAETPAELVAGLDVPRTILILVKAGDPVDDVIATLRPHLARGDTVIDGGNAHFADTIRREAVLRADGLRFLGLGISGGEAGARHGPSLMAGGDADAFDACRPMLEAAAAKVGGRPCCAHLGPDGAGHFVKMVHNGIEYGIMQAIAEATVLLRDLAGLDHTAMAAAFRSWNSGWLESYLIEITADILGTTDPETGAPLLDVILDKAGQKGTGRWSSEAALAAGVPTPSITEAVFARALASQKDQRVAASTVLKGPVDTTAYWASLDPVAAIGDALLGAAVANYAQGFQLIAAASRDHGWGIDLASVANVWRGGCVIRAAMLDNMMQAFTTSPPPDNLMCAPAFANLLADSQAGWRQAVATAALAGVPVPGLGSALAYYDGYRTGRGSANMIQAQRDYFGAHTYERTDRPGSFHTEW